MSDIKEGYLRGLLEDVTATLRKRETEIERLRGEVEAFRGKLAEQCGKTLAGQYEIERLRALLHDALPLQAENKRLRAALEIIAGKQRRPNFMSDATIALHALRMQSEGDDEARKA